MRMVLSGFITAAEDRLLRIFSGTSKCYYLLLSFLSTELG